MGQLWSRTVTTRGYDWNDPNGRIVSIADLDASTDSTATGADWLPEVCVMDWSSNCPRLRAFHPTLDANGAITGFTAVGSTVNDALQKANGDVAMVCGDLDADGLRLGPPGPPKTVTNVSQPLVILKQPPIHFDIFHDGSSGDDECFDLCGCYPDAFGYQCDDFYATYTQTSSTEETLEYISKDDFAASTTLTQSVGGKYEFLTAKAEVSLTAKVGAHFEREGRTSVSQEVTIGKDTRANGGDQVLITEQRFQAWEYPLIRRDGDGPDVKGHYLVLQTMGDPVASWKSSKDWPSNVEYPVESSPGNVLSYRELADPASDSRIEEMWLAAPVNGVSKMDMAPVLTVTYDTLTEKSLKQEWEFGFNVKGSAEVGADLEVVSATTKVEVEASYDHSQVSTRETKVGGQLRFEVGLGGLANTDGSYSIQPYIFRAKSGAIVLDYAVIPSWGDPQNPNFWDAYYSHLPDPALRLPRMFHEEWAWDYTYPEKEFWSPDIIDRARFGQGGRHGEIERQGPQLQLHAA